MEAFSDWRFWVELTFLATLTAVLKVPILLGCTITGLYGWCYTDYIGPYLDKHFGEKE